MFEIFLTFIVDREYRTVRIQGYKRRQCEFCDSEFTFSHKVTARGSANKAASGNSAESVALRRAHEKAERLFARLDPPVPCPNCHRLQPNMLAQLREKHAKSHWEYRLGLTLAAIFLMLVGIIVSGALKHAGNTSGSMVLIVCTAVEFACLALALNQHFRLRQILQAPQAYPEFVKDIKKARQLIVNPTEEMQALLTDREYWQREIDATEGQSSMTEDQRNSRRHAIDNHELTTAKIQFLLNLHPELA